MTGLGFTSVRPKNPLSEGWVAVVPVKDPVRAKSRLGDDGTGGGASETGRAGLAWAFAQDVLVALREAQGVKRVVVISDGNQTSELAKSFGCESLIDPTESLNGATKFAAESVGGESPICIWVSDLPCLQPNDVETVLAQAAAVFSREPLQEGRGRGQEHEGRVQLREGRVRGRVRVKERGPMQAFVPDDNSGGTTALLVRAPIYLNPKFGPNSANAHASVGATPLIGTPRARLDVDTQDDLKRAITLGVGPATQKALR